MAQEKERAEKLARVEAIIDKCVQDVAAEEDGMAVICAAASRAEDFVCAQYVLETEEDRQALLATVAAAFAGTGSLGPGDAPDPEDQAPDQEQPRSGDWRALGAEGSALFRHMRQIEGCGGMLVIAHKDDSQAFTAFEITGAQELEQLVYTLAYSLLECGADPAAVASAFGTAGVIVMDAFQEES